MLRLHVTHVSKVSVAGHQGRCGVADTLSAKARSRVMSAIRSKDTQPELYVRKRLWTEGFRFRLHARNLPGTPDVVLRKYGLAVFVHGCFWHQHGCSGVKRPTSNTEYWDLKLDRNVARDALHRGRLEELGWTVATLWECDLESGTERLLAELKRLRDYQQQQCAG